MLTDIEKSWVDEYLKPRYPELVPLYLEACSVASEARQSGQLTEAQANRLLELASSPRTPLSENVAGMLGQLAGSLPSAQAVLTTLAAAPRVLCRINALAALQELPVGRLHVQLISAALRDKSRRVRALAADKAMGFGMRDLLPELEHAVNHEQDSKLRDSLAWNLALLRDGYLVKQNSNGTVWVSCRRGGSVVSRSFPAGQFETDGRQWIAEQLQ